MSSGEALNTLSYCRVEDAQVDAETGRYKTLLDCLHYQANVQGDSDAFIFVHMDGRRECVSWRNLWLKSQSAARTLIHYGVQKGDIVAIDMPNFPEWLYLFFGTMQAGAIPVGIAFKNKDLSNVIAMLQKNDRCSVIVTSHTEHDDTWSVLRQYLDEVRPDGSVSSLALPYLKYVFLRYGNSTQGINDANDIREILKENHDDVSLPELSGDDIAFGKQSSGSTGPSKLVTRTHKSFMKSFYKQLNQPNYRVKVFNDNCFCWVGGFPFNVINGFTRLTLVNEEGFPFEKRKHLTFRVIVDEQCICIKPRISMIEYLTNHSDDLPKDWPVLCIVFTGLPLMNRLKKLIGKPAKVLYLTYGASECFDITAVFITDPSLFKEYYCGKMIPGVQTEMKIVDEAGKTVPVGCRGEVLLRGSSLFKGYFNDADRTSAVFTDDGWYKTDDIGMMTADKGLYVYGRKSNIINIGGIKMDANILEREFENYPGVVSVVIVTIPHEFRVNEMCACVKVQTGSTITEAEMRKYFEALREERRADFKVLPAHVMILSEFPETISGKPSRPHLEMMAKKRFISQNV